MDLFEDELLAESALRAIHAGDTNALRELMRANAGLATATITRRAGANRQAFSYPLLGAATDWPGHFPNVGETIRLLVAAGAHVNARCSGPHQETPLHGAASSDDVEAIEALLSAGADIEAPGAVIAGGTPLDDAVAFSQWQAARLLVGRGARIALWHAAALGMLERVQEHFESGRLPALYPWGGGGHDEVTVAFWCACHGGQQVAAEYLLQRGADLNWTAPWDGLTPLDAARRSGSEDVAAWLETLGAKATKAHT